MMGLDRWLKKIVMLAGFVLAFAGAGEAQKTSGPNLMPWPSKIEMGTGNLKIDSTFTAGLSGYTEPRLERAVARFLTRLREQTALEIATKASDASTAILVIHTDRASKEIQELGEDESYSLEVTPIGAKLSAANPLGILRGLQTFLQLVDVTPEGFAAPAVSIQDTPRFPWRGLMIDSARHFTPLDVLKRNLDGMEEAKLNVFHWHLSDNQGFRVESKKFPKLQELGSDGMYYTQDEVRDLIAYARDRGIRVVPEFDMPGHCTAWFVGYPELASAPGPYQIERKWGIFDPAMNPANEETYKFLDEFIGEMAKLFSDQYFHIGGDEVNGKQWDANPKIQEFMKAHGLKNNQELQGYFSTRVQKLVDKHGKTVIGWDEVLVPGAPKGIVIQSWRGQESLAQAAKEGYRGILSNGYYLDLGWSAARHYAVDPMSGAAANLTPEEKKRILGGEACMWSEYVDAENIDSRIWPRMAAIAERLWSPETMTDPDSMYARMDDVSEKLECTGLTHRTYYRKMLQRIAGPATPEEFAALKAVADVVEPVKDYTREETATVEPTSLTPLNRIVDAVPLESDHARHFKELVERFIGESCRDPKLEQQLRIQFEQWRNSYAGYAPLAQRSILANEGLARSQDMSALGTLGIEALGVLASGVPVSGDWKAQQMAFIQSATKPKAQLLLMPLSSMQVLVEAVSEGGACAVPKGTATRK
ncbi:MAG TPA: family 20 glycosylhydrolase [Terriglobales bacterium]|nr:family 20 glycosylhydrolase [Terriglobales bacterium]